MKHVRAAWIAALVTGCASAPPLAPLAPWSIPAGYRSESFPFPLEFAPALAHTGVEELRFAPGFFDPGTPGYWAYAFVWRTRDAAQLDAPALSGELTTYFRGLLTSVDEQHRISDADRATIAVTATPAGARFTLAAHVFDAFKTALPLELTGTAERRACGAGALWIIVMSPADSTRRAELDALAQAAACDQPLPPTPKPAQP